MLPDHAIFGDDRSETGASGVLADATRRRTLAVLAAAESPLSLIDLAMELARTGGPDDETRDGVRRLAIQLYHCHLPKLDAAGVVEFEHEDRRVRLAEDVAPEEVRAVLSLH